MIRNLATQLTCTSHYASLTMWSTFFFFVIFCCYFIGLEPTNTARVFHVETKQKQSFACRFNVKYTRLYLCGMRVKQVSKHEKLKTYWSHCTRNRAITNAYSRNKDGMKILYLLFNPFVPNGPFLYPLTTSENFMVF